MAEHSDAAKFAADIAMHRAEQIKNGELTDHSGDLVERCIHHHAHGLGISPEDIRAAIRDANGYYQG